MLSMWIISCLNCKSECSTCSNALTSSFSGFLCSWYTDWTLTSCIFTILGAYWLVWSWAFGGTWIISELIRDRQKNELQISRHFTASSPNPSYGAKDLTPCVNTSPCYPGNRCRGEPPGGTADLSWLFSTELESVWLPQDPCRQVCPRTGPTTSKDA